MTDIPLVTAAPFRADGAPDAESARPAMSEVEFNATAQRLDVLIRDFETLPYPTIRDQFFEALQAIDALHREGLGRLMKLIEAGDSSAVLESAHRDPVIQTLLILYDLASDQELPELPTPQNTRNFIALDQVQLAPRRPKQPVFAELGDASQVPPGTLKDYPLGNARVLVANVGGEFYAVRDVCPGSMAPLHLGSFTPPVLVCPWHNEAFDIRTGKRVDGVAEPRLSVLPVFVSDGIVKLAMDSMDLGAKPAK